MLAEVLTAAGFDAARLIAEADSAGVKAALKANTDEAVAVGACGVPTYQVLHRGHEPVLLWGQDRLHVVADVLNGWRQGDGSGSGSPVAKL